MEPLQIPENPGSFLVLCIQSYEDMMNDIRHCRRKGFTKLEEIQCCFDIANNYLTRLSDEIKTYTFNSVEDEILFFKKIKPLFTSEAEFHTYCYHAELFKNTVEDNCPAELELFYRRQLQRLNKFSRDNPFFFAYMEEGQTHHDRQWFIRDPDKKEACSYDKFMATYQAVKKFVNFVSVELQNIGEDPSLSDNPETGTS